MKNSKEKIDLQIRPRPTETVSLKIPKDTLESLKRASMSRDMSLQALLKFYIGQGLRQDLAKLFDDREQINESVIQRANAIIHHS